MALKIGSWAFVMAMLLILATWASLNVILANVFAESKAWDPYPFTLLNLFLSIIATMQGPIIMMSQNRQGDIERVQNNYIRKIILQGENQTRLVNAKMDYLITSQWRRLLEIQEIQVDLLQILQTQGSKTEKTPPASPDREPTQSAKPSSTPILKSNTNLLVPPKMDVSLIEPVLEKSFPFTVEITPDEHTGFIMRHYLNKPDHQDDLLFSHWTVEGDNFSGGIHLIT